MKHLGACGDDCSLCLRYKATISNSAQELNRVKELWISLGWREPGVDVQELKCLGCRKENKCAYQELRDCAFEKRLENCGMCSKYPCELINAAVAKTENLFRSFKDAGGKKEMDSLIKAFRYKKMNLDRIHDCAFKKNTST